MDSKYLSAICAGFLCMGTANAVPATGVYHISDFGAESRGGFQNIAVTNCAVCSPRYSQVVYGRQRGLAGIALEIVDEQIRQPVSFTFVPPAGIDIADRWQVHFNTRGDLGGMVSNKPLATTVRVESQYPSEEK